MSLTQGQLSQTTALGGQIASKTITFAGGTTNATGDHDGTGDPFSIFTVTGVVSMRLFAVVATGLAGATATIEVGTAINTAGLIAQTTATNLAANEIWHDATPDASVELATVAAEKIVSQSVIGTVGTANITSGVLNFYCIWKPLSDGASVVAA